MTGATQAPKNLAKQIQAEEVSEREAQRTLLGKQIEAARAREARELPDLQAQVAAEKSKRDKAYATFAPAQAAFERATALLRSASSMTTHEINGLEIRIAELADPRIEAFRARLEKQWQAQRHDRTPAWGNVVSDVLADAQALKVTVGVDVETELASLEARIAEVDGESR